MKCGMCGYVNREGTAACAACNARLVGTGVPGGGAPTPAGPGAGAPHASASGASDAAPGGAQGGGSPIIPPADLLRRVAAAKGDPDLFPPDVVAAFEAGRRVGAFELLCRAAAASPADADRWADVLTERRVWAEPAQPPSLVTLNGIGTTASGRAEPKPDGTYILTTYFTVLFIPLQPVNAYLVADASSGWRRSWYFLARVPRQPWRAPRALSG